MDDDDATTTTTLFTTDEACSNWSELHEDMIHLIFKKLTSAADCIRFGSVCVSWRSIPFAYLHPDLLHPQLPLLMIPTPPQLTNSSSTSTTTTTKEETRSFYVLSERSVYKDIKISLPYNRNCRGSSHGWIITSAREDTGDYSVEMFNPFISVINHEYQKIQLPPLITTFSKKYQHVYSSRAYLYKAIVSVNPSSHPRDYVVVIIYGRMTGLSFWRPGDQVWTHVHLGHSCIGDQVWTHVHLGDSCIRHEVWTRTDLGPGCILHDVIYLKGLFYLVDHLGEVTVVDVNGGAVDQPPCVRRLDVVAPRPDEQLLPSSYKKYLVESAGDLLLVDKGGDSDDDTEFRVFKLITDQKGTYKWEVLNTLPGRMLFLGDNASISLAASDFPGGKSSCIYFTDNESKWHTSTRRYPHMGIFDMEENKTIEFQRLHPMGQYISTINTIWVESTLRCCFRF